MPPKSSSRSRSVSDWIHDLQSPLAALRSIRSDELSPEAADLLHGAMASLEALMAEWKGEKASAAVQRGRTADPVAREDESGPLAIEIPRGAVVAVLDDDPAIHLAWKRRFEELPDEAIERVVSASNPREMRLAMREFPDFFLLDHDLAGHAETGLDLIIELGIARQAWLVTGRALEPSIRERCARHGVRLFAKERLAEVRLAIGSSE